MTDNPHRGRAFAALRHPTFRLFYGGLVLSSFGTSFTQLAISWQIYEITGSSLQLGLLGLSRAVVMMPMLFYGGLLADAFDRRKLLMFTQAGQLGLALFLLVMTAAGTIAPIDFYIVSIGGGFLLAVENPARLAMVPNMVPESDLTNAIALNGMQRSVSTVAGPPIAGVILGFFGPVANYAVDALTFLAMLVALAIVRPVNAQAVGGRRQMSLTSIGEGLTYVSQHPILLIMMLLDFVANIFGAVRALLPVYASDILKVGPEGFGVLSGASAVGSILGGVTMGIVGQVRRMGLFVLLAVAMFAACTILFAYNTNFYIALALLVGTGFSDTVSMVLRTTILQINIPDTVRGRVTALNQIFTTGGGPLGSFRAGAIGQWWGPEIAVVSGGLIVLGFVLVLGVSMPYVRRFVIEPEAHEVTSQA